MGQVLEVVGNTGLGDFHVVLVPSKHGFGFHCFLNMGIREKRYGISVPLLLVCVLEIVRLECQVFYFGDFLFGFAELLILVLVFPRLKNRFRGVTLGYWVLLNGKIFDAVMFKNPIPFQMA